MNSTEVSSLAVTALEDMKGVDLKVIDIAEKSSIADAMVIVTGTSQRHVRSWLSPCVWLPKTPTIHL